jgi:hypothetical protein
MKKLRCLLTCALAMLLCSEISVQADISGKMVFIDQSFKLYVANIGETPTEVPLSGLYNVNFPHWSPDAQWITFTANPQDNSTGAQVYMVRPDGSGLHRVTNGSGDLSCPSFSPDGSKILYSQVYGNLFTINVDGSNLINLGVPGGLAEWSSDGTKISYTNWGWTYESDIFIYDTVSQTSFQLTHHNPGEAFITATWAPDGTQLALGKHSYGNNKDDVCKINADGTGFVNLTETLPGNECWPNWSAGSIFFQRDLSGVYDIWLMSPDGSNLQNITNSPTLQELPLFDVVPEPACGTQLFFDDFTGTALDTSRWSVVGGSPQVAGGFLQTAGYHTRIDSIPAFAPMGQNVMASARIRLAGEYHKFGFRVNPTEGFAGPISGYYFDTLSPLDLPPGREGYVRALAWFQPDIGSPNKLLDVEIPVTWYEFHEFAIERTPSEVIYSIDGQEVASVADTFAGALPVGVWNDRWGLMQTDWVEVASIPKPPVANAGENIQILSANQATTVVQGTANDPDGDALEYRWVEGANVLSDWTAVGTNGEAYLNLGTLPLFSIGNHTLTLEVREIGPCGLSASDDMVLTIENSPPVVQAAPKHQVVEIGIDPIVVVGDAGDFDGDTLAYQWLDDGNNVLASGIVSTTQGGEPIPIPDLNVPPGDTKFPVGEHTIRLQVSDGINEPVNDSVSVEVIDTTAPSLSPVPSVTILWPPNHKLIPVTILANAFDNSGGDIVLSVMVESSEPADAIGDGDTDVDYYVDSVNNETGVIELRLRSERSGKGSGRVYTITITATDSNQNQSQAIVQISAPHDRSKK